MKFAMANTLKLLVNGELRQSANLSTMSISPSQQMTSLQSWAPVVAGDFCSQHAFGVAQLCWR